MTGKSPLDADADFMRSALLEAQAAATRGEVPVGACLVLEEGEVVLGANRTLADRDPTAHAEIVVLRQAAARIGNHRLGGTLFVTLEPCLMCMGALVQARVERLVFAARDPKAGAAVSLYRVGEDARLNHAIAVEEGPFSAEAGRLLTEFFRVRRG